MFSFIPMTELGKVIQLIIDLTKQVQELVKVVQEIGSRVKKLETEKENPDA